ncbi:MAG: peptidylprolyl isomerase [Oscillospiraceae bacterium]|nr:peptidylprolyl isomerase [Oscillospiraceae bacterium]
MDSKVLAVIDGAEITESALDRIIEKYPVEKRIYFETEQGRKQLLEQKVAFSVFGKHAREKGADQTEQFKNRLNDIIDQMLTQAVMSELFEGVTVEDGEARKFYDENPDKFVLEETVLAKHILVDTEEQALDIRNRIESEEISFEDAAAEFSQCPSREKGGSLGYFKHGMMVKEFDEAAFSQPVGQMSAPVKTQFGWHIIVTEDKTEPGTLPFDEVSEKLEEQLKEKKQQEVYEELYNSLREKYNVKIFED